ncbi:MAG: hypothetical protein Q4D66_02385 [Bacteroidales bacterium]|nr:hypothetical protein [Bacteroidales bacterium]
MKFFLLLFLSSFVLFLPAQRKKGASPKGNKIVPKAPIPQLSPEEYKLRYEFAKAAASYRSQPATNDSETERDSLEALAQQCDRAEILLANCDRIVFVDSLVFDKTTLFSHLPLSQEAGYVLPTSALFQDKDLPNTQLGTGAYINPLRSAAHFSATVGHQARRLYSSFSSSGVWTAPAPLPGIIDSVFVEADFPFLLTDGITLYFAAKGRESIGGYDLFATRYNPSQHRYVHPTNVGMPFNSPDNDYLMAIDAHQGLGYLLTDRRQPEGKVCLYTFLPKDEHRQLSDTTSRSTRIAQAQIASIAHTQWGEESELEAYRARRIVEHSEAPPLPQHFRFIVCDDKIYHRLQDFQSSEARAQAEKWIGLQKQLQKIQLQHATLQASYARTRQQEQSNRLRQYEQQIHQLTTQLRFLSQRIRKAELEVITP